jgi:NTE family protein
VGRLGNPTISLTQAVAASSAFPPFLSPMKLRLGAENFFDWPSTARPIVPAGDINAYRKQVVLTDGGVYDNHGIEPVLKRYMTVFVSDGGRHSAALPQ